MQGDPYNIVGEFTEMVHNVTNFTKNLSKDFSNDFNKDFSKVNNIFPSNELHLAVKFTTIGKRKVYFMKKDFDAPRKEVTSQKIRCHSHT